MSPDEATSKQHLVTKPETNFAVARPFMDEPLTTPRRTWPLLLVLLLIAVTLRVWQVKTTEVAARDCISYTRIAWRLENSPWAKVMRTSPQHPAYPLTVLATSLLVRNVHPGSLPDVMQYSAQLSSSITGILLVVPMFYLGCILFDRRVSFWATLLFQCMPASGRLLADGLSESLFILFIVTGLLLATLAFQRRSPWYFVGVGLCGALAYLTRPEGMFLVIATAIVMAALQIRQATRRPWRNFGASAAGLTVGTLLLASPFMIVIGGFSNKNTANFIMFGKPANLDEHGKPYSSVRQPLPGLATQPVVIAIWDGGDQKNSTDRENQRRLWAVYCVFEVLGKLYLYWLWIPMLLGLWVRRERFWMFAGSWVLVVIPLTLLPILYRVPMKMGYLSERHAILILCCTIYTIIAGILWASDRMAAFLGGRPWMRWNVWPATLIVLICLSGLMRTLEPMHGERTGFREAGYWLAENAQPDDVIDDPYRWASYYAGRDFVEQAAPPPAAPHCLYVVFERSNNKHADLPPVANMAEVMEKGVLVKSWPVHRRHDKAEILLYKLTF